METGKGTSKDNKSKDNKSKDNKSKDNKSKDNKSKDNKVTLKYVFDEQTLLQLKSLFKEIDGNQQSSCQNMASECKLRQITFSHDKESRILSFTGKVEKKKVQTGIPGKYNTHYLFECYDITPPISRSEVTDDMLAIWECERRDARAVLNYLSRNITDLEISKITTCQIYAADD
jgi:hypothetical protein